jgi:diguanylate cyclase (GGDEF)-like protein
MEESNQFRENVGIVYLDINNLKHVNDSQGHIAGDKLILRSSEAIRFYFEDHWVFRVGGDEFVILTQGLSREEFFDLADRSKRTFERENLASLGYDYYETVDDLQRCVDECDAKMYAHKKQKKARLVQLTPKEPRLVTVAEESCPAL